jgi:hypothetical protein
VRRTLALLLVGLVGFVGLAAACSSGKSHTKPSGHLPSPQPTTGKTGTPSGPSNTNRTTTAQSK